ncbi:MAG: hypothetical protein Kow00121_02940 [Elainellaceae cyanobacterium]
MKPFLSQLLPATFIGTAILIGLSCSAIAQSSTEVESDVPLIPPITPVQVDPWQDREDEIQQQNQEEETQLQEEYATPEEAPTENVDEPGVIPEVNSGMDEDPY